MTRKRHENVMSIVMNRKCLNIQKTPCAWQGKVAPCNIDVRSISERYIAASTLPPAIGYAEERFSFLELIAPWLFCMLYSSALGDRG